MMEIVGPNVVASISCTIVAGEPVQNVRITGAGSRVFFLPDYRTVGDGGSGPIIVATGASPPFINLQ